MPQILTAEDIAKRIAAECAFLGPTCRAIAATVAV
jgi:hypothetical protein